jgi:hypothetical protein
MTLPVVQAASGEDSITTTAAGLPPNLIHCRNSSSSSGLTVARGRDLVPLSREMIDVIRTLYLDVRQDRTWITELIVPRSANSRAQPLVIASSAPSEPAYTVCSLRPKAGPTLDTLMMRPERSFWQICEACLKEEDGSEHIGRIDLLKSSH